MAFILLPLPGLAKWSACQTHDVDLFSVVPSTNPWPPLQIANWVPAGILNHAMLYFELFVSKYL